MSDIKFNYIITIHNKENLINEVMSGAIRCCNDNSYIYPVLDGCTDNSENIIDEVIKNNKNINIKKVYANDVHELLSINAGLDSASHEGEGYNIILQDDVILEDEKLEQKIINLYKAEGDKLGYVSFRMGANLKKDALILKEAVPYKDYIENCFGCGGGHVEMLPLGSIAYRTVPIKSPVCIPFYLINNIGVYDEKMAPYGHDDIDFALRVINKGYYNLVYAIKFTSELEWGGTRQEGHLVVDSIIEKNMDYIRRIHAKTINNIVSKPQNKTIKKIEKSPLLTNHECKQLWKGKVSMTSTLKYKMHPLYIIVKRYYVHYILKKVEGFKFGKLQPSYDKEFNFTDAVAYYKTRNKIHRYYHHYYTHRLPKVLKDHREYIEKRQKGFGEAAFHAMWWKLILEYKPSNCLEIGVYRGQVISLWMQISELLNQKMNISGISPFTSAGDSVSNYLKELDYHKDTLETFTDLGLEKPTLVKGFSSDENAVEYINSTVWDMIYIDGGHDYEDVLFDYKLCLKNLKKGGLIILDDASLYTDYSAVSFSFAGHPGPSQVAREYADKEMIFIGAVGHNNVYMKK